MMSAPVSVLLLGWDEAPRAGEVSTSAVRPVVQALSPRLQLAVVLPREPRPALAAATGTRITALATLTEAEVATSRPRPDQRPDQWQQPSAPYVGATETPLVSAVPAPAWTAPAAPYLGATPAAASSGTFPAAPVQLLAAPTLPLPGTDTVSPTGQQTSAVPAADLLLNRDEFAEDLGSPDAAEAADLSQPASDLTPDAPALLPDLPQRATIPEALAALETAVDPGPDLNYQVIQYARFATRRALRQDFGVVYATDWPTWLAALEIRQQTGRPLVLHVQSLAQERATAADRGWALELERLTLRRADLVLAATEEVARLLRTRYQLDGNRLQVVAPTDTDTIDAALRRFDGRPPQR